MFKRLSFLLLLPLLGAHPESSPQRPGGKDYALFFAVETYDNSKTWRTLPGVIKEVEAIASDLSEMYGFTETKVIKNPSLVEIDSVLSVWRKKKFDKNDQLFIYFSGHGQYEDDRKQGYFIPRDGQGSVGLIYNRQWLPYLDLLRSVNSIECQHIFLALDACYSGTADGEMVLTKDENEEWETPSDLHDQEWNQRISDQLRCKSRFLFTSGGKVKTENPSKFAASFRKAFSKQGGIDRIVRPADIEEEWYGLAIQPHSATFEGHEACGSFLFVYQPRQTPRDPDPDGDGVLEPEDECPNQKGAFRTKGCPDSDRDGIADKDDRCKDVAGKPEYKGCPTPPFTNPFADQMVEVKAGKFTMGSTDGEPNQQPQHQVQLSPFKIAKYEVTIGQFLAFCEATDSHWPEWLEKGNKYNIETGIDDFYAQKGMKKSNKNYPITGISWDDAVAFCEWLSEQTGKNYRLPTEAEWEFAARGGLKSKNFAYAGSNELAEVGWFNGNAENKLHPVGTLEPNELGLYDMSGNVWEWCADWYDPNYYNKSPEKDPKGPSKGTERVCRGGAWYYQPYGCRTANRNNYHPSNRSDNVGFRVVEVMNR